jgi:signal transduction histidine kinase
VHLMSAHPELARLLLSASDARAANPKAQLKRALLEVQKAEHERANLEERLRALVEASSDVVYRMSADCKQMQQLVGRQFLANTDSPDESWIERRIHPKDQPMVVAAIEQAVRIKSPFEFEHRVLHADGSLGWTFSRAVPILGEDGEITEWVGMATDVTERKRSEETLLNAERLASLGRMAVAISHEINNPLEAVTNLLYLARRAEGLPAMAREQLQQADTELGRVAHIARQALGFYRESAAPAPTDITDLMESTIDLLKSKIKARHASIEKEWRAVPVIRGVAGELRQVFSNLLANSLDAVDDGGTIKVRISRCTMRDRPSVRVTFADNGRGIDPEAKNHIFEALYTTKGAIGTGLGLWVSKQLVGKHQGRIQMRSSRNGSRKGSTFSVVLFCDL